jgi:GT2 family glycosyltransferase
VDVVVVTHNSRTCIRDCVSPFVDADGVRVIVVDNASIDGTPSETSTLPVSAIDLETNVGFSSGCNTGWRSGHSPLVLLLNPDARIDVDSLERMARVLEQSPRVGAVGPTIVDSEGHLTFSQRSFPRVRSTFGQALFLHRVFPRARWADEVIRDPEAYVTAGSPDWVSGACLLVRRTLLEALGGLDEGFFLYCEDTDLCRRIRTSGYDIRFEPSATCRHAGGASSPRSSLLPVLAKSRIRYARKHYRWPAAILERVGIGLGAAVHVVVSRGGLSVRAGHARSLREALVPLAWSNR